ncbi:MAG: hypothetical protein R3244_10015 [Thermoanaerobaculia bacterium]|nr:hypothetical protein [Thermoanaerobaculia bacterium]
MSGRPTRRRLEKGIDQAEPFVGRTQKALLGFVRAAGRHHQ